MNQSTFHEQPSGQSQCAAILEALIAAYPNRVSMPELARLSGSMNVHSRIADLRKRGWNIPAPEIERHGRRLHSYYRLASLP